VRIGDPRDASTLMGPVVNHQAVVDLESAARRVTEEGGEILCGGERLDGPDFPGGHYVTPCIARARNEFDIVQEETFAPILYILGYGSADASPAQAVEEVAEGQSRRKGSRSRSKNRKAARKAKRVKRRADRDDRKDGEV